MVATTGAGGCVDAGADPGMATTDRVGATTDTVGALTLSASPSSLRVIEGEAFWTIIFFASDFGVLGEEEEEELEAVVVGEIELGEGVAAGVANEVGVAGDGVS